MKKLFSIVFVLVLITSITALVGCNGLWGFDDDDDVVAGPIAFNIPASINVNSIDASMRPVVASGTATDFSAFGAMVYLRDITPADGLVDTLIATAAIAADGTFTLNFSGYAAEYYVKVANASGSALLFKYFGMLTAATSTTQIVNEDSTAIGLIIEGARSLGLVKTVVDATADPSLVTLVARIKVQMLGALPVDKLVTGVQLKGATSIVVGATETLTEVIAPADAADKAVVWASSLPGIATVSNVGLVTAVAVGTTNITVTTHDGNLVATCVVTVTPIRVASVSVAPTTLSLVTAQTGNLVATVLPANAADKTVAWTTSNANVATVSNVGLVTAVGAGTANITVTTTDGAKTAVCAVTVTAAPVPLTGVSLNPATLALTVGGSTSTLTPVFAPVSATDKVVVWSVAPAGIINVSQLGVVTPVAVGVATVSITAHDGGFVGKCTVTVTAAPVAPKTVITFDKTVTGLSLADLKIFITAGTSTTFNAATFTTSTVVVAGATNRDVVKETTESNNTQLVLMFNGLVFDAITDFNTLTFTTAIPGGAVVKIMNPAGDTLATSNNL